MTQSRESIRLNFHCGEDLDAMICTSSGRFCGSCQKEVIDFTSKSLSQIKAHKSDREEMCGIFLPEQLDPSLHPIELPNLRSWAFVSTIMVSLNLGNLAAQSTIDPKVEQAQGASNAPNMTPEAVKQQMESGSHISMSVGETQQLENSIGSEKEKKTKHYKKLYWSKRFPFIHRKNRKMAGAYAYYWE